MKRIIILTVVSWLLAGFVGCASSPKYPENSEIPWEVFYAASHSQNEAAIYHNISPEYKKLPNVFYVEGYIKPSIGGNGALYQTDGSPARINDWGQYRYDINDRPFVERLELDKMYRIRIRKELPFFVIDFIDGLPTAEQIRAVRIAERDARRTEERQQREEELKQLRFSPEGQEYIKRTLIQAVGESRNQANRGKTLFFESSRIKITNSTVAGHYLISDSIQNPNDYVIMEFYNNIPWLRADFFSGFTILYRVEINQLGVAMFKIDSFK
jgi:hypothetical protein